MTDPQHRSGSDRLGEVARHMDAEVIINVQGDEPLIDPAIIDAVIKPFGSASPPDMATVAVPLRSSGEYVDRHIVKVVCRGDGRALYFSRSPIPWGWKGEGPGVLRHVGIYAYSREALLKFTSAPHGKMELLEDLEQLRALEIGMEIEVIVMEQFSGIGVDRPEDLEKVLHIMENEQGDKAPRTLQEGP